VEVRQRLKTVTVHRPDRDPATRGLEATLTSDDAGFSVDRFALAIVDVFAGG
jgi:hypothetical protein